MKPSSMRAIYLNILFINLISHYASAVLFSMPGVQPSLNLIQVLYRHGDRTPIHLLPNDIHSERWRSMGSGQLTKVGKEQHYVLGQYLRRHYDEFLNISYQWDEVVVNSTNVDRTLMSAASNLAGLFPPVGKDVWDPRMPWQPIPVHTTQLDIDYLLNPDANCPRYNEIAKDVLRMPEFEAINKENEELLKFIANNTQLEISTILDVTAVYDTLKIEKLYNLSMPSWLNDTVFNKMRNLSDLAFKWHYITPEQQMLRGGPLLGQMINNMEKKVNDTKSKMKIYMYSAHDTTLTAFLMNLNLFNYVIPPYIATVIVELHALHDGPYVQVLYKNSTILDPMILTVPGCTSLCPLQKFISIYKNNIPYDIVDQCQAKLKCNDTFSWTVSILVISLTVVLAVLLIVLVLYWKKHKDQDFRYMMVNDE